MMYMQTQTMYMYMLPQVSFFLSFSHLSIIMYISPYTCTYMYLHAVVKTKTKLTCDPIFKKGPCSTKHFDQTFTFNSWSLCHFVQKVNTILYPRNLTITLFLDIKFQWFPVQNGGMTSNWWLSFDPNYFAVPFWKLHI